MEGGILKEVYQRLDDIEVLLPKGEAKEAVISLIRYLQKEHEDE